MSTTHGAALVSGASRGLGAVIAGRLAADGWPVAVNYRSGPERDEAGHVVEDILARGGTAGAFAADVTDEAAVAGLVSRATDQLGSIDVLVVNATGPQPVVPLEELSWQDHLDQLLFFVKSPTLLVQAVLPGMKERTRPDRPDRLGHLRARGAGHVSLRGRQGSSARPDPVVGSGAGSLRYHRELRRAPGWIPVERHADSRPTSPRPCRSSRPTQHPSSPASG